MDFYESVINCVNDNAHLAIFRNETDYNTAKWYIDQYGADNMWIGAHNKVSY